MSNLLIGAFLLAAALAGCSEAKVTPKTDGYPKDWIVIISPGNFAAYVVPVTLNDGTKCVVVTANSSGRGITCNWQGTHDGN